MISEGLAPTPARRRDTLDALVERVRPTTLARDRRLPVLSVLEPLVPGGGLRRGTTVAVDVTAGATGATSLALALVAGASRRGAWVAAVGLGSLGLVAAAEAGVVLERLVLITSPGRAAPTGQGSGGGWPAVVAALVDGFDVVLVGSGRDMPLRAADARRLVARVRERGTVLVAVGGELPGERSPLRLTVTSARWSGLDRGAGHLHHREVTVSAAGRGDATRPRQIRLWLPGPDGGIATPEAGGVVDLAEAQARRHRSSADDPPVGAETER